ncbi:MAG: PDZ domain-containing protein, partial [Dehalococcoidia bacterium]
MSYVQRNLLPLIVGLFAVVAIIIGTGSVVMRMRGDRISDAQFERELGRRIEGAMRNGSATLGVTLDAGMKVTGVVPNGAGDAAGIKVGDQLVSINGNAVSTVDEARARVAAVPQNTDYTVTVSRDGKTLDLTAKKGTAAGNLGGMFQ